MTESKRSIANIKKSRSDKSATGHDDFTSGLSVIGGENESTIDQIGKGVGTAKITINREEYLQAYRDLANEIRLATLKNSILHRRLAEHYKKRKCEHALKPFEGAADLEDKYQKKLIAYEELKEKTESETSDLREKVRSVEIIFLGQHEHAESKFIALQNLERSTGTGLIYSKKGKPIADKTVKHFLTLQMSKWSQASALCLRYIRARNAVTDLEVIVKKLESLAPGLYVYRYEELHDEHESLMTKIEEREDELIKNRGRCTEHNQILAHIREKMHHTEEVIDHTECDLGEAEIEFTRAREDLGFVKSRRNNLRWMLEAERVKAGLLTRKDLLRDFQDASEMVEVLRKKKYRLQFQITKTSVLIRETRQNMYP